MSYQVRIEKKILKKLEKISEPWYSQIKHSILELGNEPRPAGTKKLKGQPAYRIRVADYRIIYEIEDQVRIVDVIDLGHRSEIYGQ
jgi:mRNA interferase RelE/StbE